MTRAVVTMTIDDAEHYTPEQRAAIVASYPAHEREARAKGIPTLGSGRIFPIEEEAIKVEPFKIPTHWPRINGIDFGWDHPSAGVQNAWDRDNDCWYVIKAHRAREQTPILFAPAVKAWGEWVPTAWPHDGLQHDKGSGGNSVEAGLLDMLDRMQTGRFKVFSNLGEWFQEFRMYHRKDGKVVKEREDLMSATRYGLMMKRKAIVQPVQERSVMPQWQALDSEVGI